MANTHHGPPPPAELTNGTSSLCLLSQGAEARVWLVTLPDSESNDAVVDNDNGGGGGKHRSLHVGGGIHVPHLVSFAQRPSPLWPTTTNPSTTDDSPLRSKRLRIICKERFPKKYRHPQLDVSLTKSRTKAEARSLIRCQRAGIPCPNVLAVAHWSNNHPENESPAGNNGGLAGNSPPAASTTSSCIFLECVEGCTVRQYFEQRSGSQLSKVLKEEADRVDGKTSIEQSQLDDPTISAVSNEREDRITTVIDSHTLCVAHTIGMLVAKMHCAGVIHGDLTTSNIMLSNPPQLVCTDGGNTDSTTEQSWRPHLVLIDFGLATSSSSTGNNTSNTTSGAKKSTQYKQQHNAEEKAVDLYVLERAFLSTHPESELLVEEVLKGYRSYFESLDCMTVDDNNAEEVSEAITRDRVRDGADAVKAILNRLEQVRMRGRKRECFG